MMPTKITDYAIGVPDELGYFLLRVQRLDRTTYYVSLLSPNDGVGYRESLGSRYVKCKRDVFGTALPELLAEAKARCERDMRKTQERLDQIATAEEQEPRLLK